MTHSPEYMPVESFIGVLRGLEQVAQQRAQVALLQDASSEQPGRFLARNRDDPVVGFAARRETFSNALSLLRDSISDDNESAVRYEYGPYVTSPPSAKYVHSHSIVQSSEPVAFPFMTETGQKFGVFARFTGYEKRRSAQFPLAHNLAADEQDLLIPEQGTEGFAKQLMRELEERIVPSKAHAKAIQELCTVETTTLKAVQVDVIEGRDPKPQQGLSYRIAHPNYPIIPDDILTDMHDAARAVFPQGSAKELNGLVVAAGQNMYGVQAKHKLLMRYVDELRERRLEERYREYMVGVQQIVGALAMGTMLSPRQAREQKITLPPKR